MRKIIYATTRSELDKRINQYKERKWKVISDVKHFNCSYGVLLEKADGLYGKA